MPAATTFRNPNRIEAALQAGSGTPRDEPKVSVTLAA
jgi:hypothetical protein